MRNDEHNLQSDCVRWFDLQYPKYKVCFMAIPNGGHRHKAVAGKLKAEGICSMVKTRLEKLYR